MPAYLIVNVDIKDRIAFEDYVRDVPPIVRKFGGEYLAVSDTPEVIEGSWQPHRLVLVRFPDMAAAQAFLDAPEYVPWRELRKRVTISEMVALEGLR
ncbi:MAG TPA: DUF1330 domain-containing protein [Terriglobales bacterium]|nr:DUF1330 domain-containing protein [Terriglobales bacterium]